MNAQLMAGKLTFRAAWTWPREDLEMVAYVVPH